MRYNDELLESNMPPERPKWTPCGEEDKKEKEEKDPRSCDKLQHWLRSLCSQPNHIKVEKKIQKPKP